MDKSKIPTNASIWGWEEYGLTLSLSIVIKHEPTANGRKSALLLQAKNHLTACCGPLKKYCTFITESLKGNKVRSVKEDSRTCWEKENLALISETHIRRHRKLHDRHAKQNSPQEGDWEFQQVFQLLGEKWSMP